MVQLRGWGQEGDNLDERTVLKAMEGLGYLMLPQAHRHSPGGSGLLVAIRREPTGRHFDPKTMRLRLRDRQGMAKWWSLSLESPDPDLEHFCPGRATLCDRSDRRVEFYTFGGSLEVIVAEDARVYVLHSTAPVLELVTERETIADQLAAETESLLGRADAQWGYDEYGFNRRLAEIDPLQFYMGTLHHLMEQYEHCEALEEIYHELYGLLQHEKRWLVSQGLWPAKAVAIESLLGKG
jgi:hypothetical protein